MVIFQDLRLIPAALAAWLGIAILIGAAPVTVAISAAILILVGIAALLWSCGAQGTVVIRSVGYGAAIVGMVFAVCAVQLQGVANSRVPDLAAGGYHTQLTGMVVSAPQPAPSPQGGEPGSRFTLQVESVTARGVTTRAPAGVRARVQVMSGVAASDQAPYGATITVSGTLRPGEPGDRVSARIFAQDAPRVLAPPSKLIALSNSLRTGLMARTVGLSDQARGLVPGAGIGDTSAMTDALKDAMKATSLTHITAVSGSHFAIIFTVVIGGLWFCPRWLRVTLIAATMVGFVVLVHPEPSVQRAAVMCAVMVFAMTLRRPSASLTAWAVAILALLVLDPWLSRQYGFVLSVLATGGLIIGTAPIASWLHNEKQPRWWMPRRLALIIAVPIAAQAACGPILILLEPQISAYSVPANLFAAPALVPATLCAVGATLIGPFWGGAANVLVTIASGATWWIAKVAFFFAGLPGARIPWWPGWFGVALLAVVTAIVFTLLLAPPARRWAAPVGAAVVGRLPLRVQRFLAQSPAMLDRNRALLTRFGYVAGTIVVLNVVLWLRPPWLSEIAGTTHFGGDWQMGACDVGQGDALLINVAPGTALMIDTGPPDGNLGHCLGQFGITQVPTLFLTHFHADHIGGVRDLLATATVGKILVPAVTATGPERGQVAAIERIAREYRVPLEFVTAPLDGQAGPAAWHLIGPTPELAGKLSRAQGHGGEVLNDSSLVLEVDYQGQASETVRMIFLGDLELPGQESLLATLRGRDPASRRYDLVKVAHHGSGVQNAALARMLSPSLSIMSFAKDNSYGHPHPKTVDLVTAVGSQTWDTARCGSFAVRHTTDRWFVVADCP